MTGYNSYVDKLSQHWVNILRSGDNTYLDTSAEYLQSQLNSEDSESFPIDGSTGGTDLYKLLEVIFNSTTTSFLVNYLCENCNYINRVETRSSALWHLPLQSNTKQVGDILRQLWKKKIRSACNNCPSRNLTKSIIFNNNSPAWFATFLSQVNENVQLTMQITISNPQRITYKLRGIIYFGSQHFICRIIDKAGHIFYHDRIVTGRQCKYESHFRDLSTPLECEGKKAVVAIYSHL